jgi:hypothetical protein
MQGELQNAARIGGRNLAERGGGYGNGRGIWILELRVIEHVEGVHAQFKVVVFTEPEVLRYR